MLIKVKETKKSYIYLYLFFLTQVNQQQTMILKPQIRTKLGLFVYRYTSTE